MDYNNSISLIKLINTIEKSLNGMLVQNTEYDKSAPPFYFDEKALKKWEYSASIMLPQCQNETNKHTAKAKINHKLIELKEYVNDFYKFRKGEDREYEEGRELLDYCIPPLEGILTTCIEFLEKQVLLIDGYTENENGGQNENAIQPKTETHWKRYFPFLGTVQDAEEIWERLHTHDLIRENKESFKRCFLERKCKMWWYGRANGLLLLFDYLSHKDIKLYDNSADRGGNVSYKKILQIFNIKENITGANRKGSDKYQKELKTLLETHNFSILKK